MQCKTKNTDLLEQEDNEETQMHTKIHSFIVVALIAVELARVEGKIGDGDFSASNFLSGWLKKAFKQKRFHRDLADLIKRFIDSVGPHHSLRVDLYTIHNEYRAVRLKTVFFEKPDMIRLNTALESLRSRGVNVQNKLDYSPEKDGPYQHKTDNELFILKIDYELSVKSNDLIQPLNIYIVGDRQPTIDALYDNGFIAEIARESKLKSFDYSHFRIYPKNNDISGSIAIPTILL
jgi:hypothetical protein